MRRTWGIIRGQESLELALPAFRLRLLTRLKPRLVWPLLGRDGFQFSLFLTALERELAPANLVIVDANLWLDGGRGIPTKYHHDLWWSAAVENRVIQLWIPLMAIGSPAEIARSMVRLDPNPMDDDWVAAPGTFRYTHIRTGETRPLAFEHDEGRLQVDLDGALGGSDLRPGDALYFDNAYAHYTLPSRARRVGMAVRMTQGPPVYSGYFDEPGPLDGQASSDWVRVQLKDLLCDFRPGEVVPRELILDRFAQGRRDWLFRLKSWLLLFCGRRRLHPILQRFAQKIGSELRLCSAKRSM